MKIKDLFARDVTRDIPPVIYFHETDPEQVQKEVSEYIITGGYPEGDPRHRRIQMGIHEQFVALLKALDTDLKKSGGVELPSSWISGFYGSGKSSFAKLLGLALDGLILPDGRRLSDALIERDNSPRSNEFQEAWRAVRDRIDPMSVIFDIGTVARDDEYIHSAVKRQIQKRLGYCPMSDLVAEHELKLEMDGQYDTFLRQAQQTLGKSWDKAKLDHQAEDHFSHVLHDMDPDRYIDPMSWIDSKAGAVSTGGSSVEEATRDIANMLKMRAQGKTLFVVVDEVSQYIYQNDNRQVKLQSFVSDLGQKLKGKVWLFTLGQQKLEDDDNIGKLKDRFPSRLRVHLAPTNIRDVVHQRLLEKSREKEELLRRKFGEHRSNLKLYAYDCSEITEQEFVDVYPLLPGYVDLIMQITTNLRVRSTRVKGDDHAVRGLLQLLGDIFREKSFGEEEVGQLVTLDQVYDIQSSALNADVQNTLAMIFGNREVVDDELTIRVAKAVALLELIQEQHPTTVELVAQCLYSRLGMGSQIPEIKQRLEKLRDLGLLSYTERYGYKIQSSAGQDWQRERATHDVTDAQKSALVREKLRDVAGELERPSLKGTRFPWKAFYNDGRQYQDDMIQGGRDSAVITVDFQYLKTDSERDPATWIGKSDQKEYRDRIIWVAGKPGTLNQDLQELEQSRAIINRYQPRVASLQSEKQRLFYEEQTRRNELERKIRDSVEAVFLSGTIYFRGRQIDPRQSGSTFISILQNIGGQLLPEIYDQFVEISITPGELKQLLEPQLNGPSLKFMENELGILELDAGKYVPSCKGQVPRRIEQYVIDNNGVAGGRIFDHYGGPPYGYGDDLVRACVAGLLRAGKIRIRPEAGPEITSIRDPGANDTFTKDRDFRRSDFLPPRETGISQRDIVRIAKLIETRLGVTVERQHDAIADTVFQNFPRQVRKLEEVEGRLRKLPDYTKPPEVLIKLRDALQESTRSRQVLDTIQAIQKNYDVLNDGLEQLALLSIEITDDRIDAVRTAADVRDNELRQLEEVHQAEEVQSDAEAVCEHLKFERPWREIEQLQSHLEAIRQQYSIVRTEYVERVEQRADQAREEVRAREGFARLDSDGSHQVLRPIFEASKPYLTSHDPLYPTLQQLHEVAAGRIAQGLKKAHEKLDELLSSRTEVQVIPFSVHIHGREVSSESEIDAFVEELRERLKAQLKENTRLRILAS